jgi:hypothetical protein
MANTNNPTGGDKKQTYTEAAGQYYNQKYETWMPWIEDKYLSWFTKDNKASYATKRTFPNPFPTLIPFSHYHPSYLLPHSTVPYYHSEPDLFDHVLTPTHRKPRQNQSHRRIPSRPAARRRQRARLRTSRKGRPRTAHWRRVLKGGN